MMHSYRRVAAVAMAVALAHSPVRADSLTWVGGGSGAYTTASNWQNSNGDPAVPTGSDNVVIDSGTAVSISSGKAFVSDLGSGCWRAWCWPSAGWRRCRSPVQSGCWRWAA